MWRRTISLLLTLAVLGGFGWLAISAVQGGPEDDRMADLVAIQNAFAELAEKVTPCVVSVNVERNLKEVHPEINDADEETKKRFEEYFKTIPAAGSGVVIRQDGMVLTNEHVIYGADKAAGSIKVTLHTGRQYPASIIGSDPRSDLSVIHINESGLQAVKLGDLHDVRRGHWAVAMGNPFGLAADGRASMSCGIVSNIGRALPNIDLTQTRFYGDLIETDAAINPGNSGGPLLNIRGELIGINTAISTRSGVSEGVGFAVPISQYTKDVINLLIEGSEVEYGFLGVEIETPKHEQRVAAGVSQPIGAVVRRVDEASPASEAKLKEDDLITHFDGIEIKNQEHLVTVVGHTMVDRTVEVKYYRDGKPSQTSVTIRRRNIGRLKREVADWKWRGMVIAEPDSGMRQKYGLGAQEKGLVVVSVVPGTPADRSGFREGDVIVKVGNVTVAEISHVRQARQQLAGNVPVVLKGGQVRDLGG